MRRDAEELSLKNLFDHALVDTAAGQALIRRCDLANLEMAFQNKGYRIQVTWGEVEGCSASGIGGRVKPAGKALVPVTIHNCGIVEFLILPGRCPPLLPARYLAFLSAKIDLESNQMIVGEPPVKRDLHRPASGHLSTCLIPEPEDQFELSDELSEQLHGMTFKDGKGRHSEAFSSRISFASLSSAFSESRGSCHRELARTRGMEVSTGKDGPRSSLGSQPAPASSRLSSEAGRGDGLEQERSEQPRANQASSAHEAGQSETAVGLSRLDHEVGSDM